MRERGLAAGPSLTVYLPYGNNAVPTEFVVHTRGNPTAFAPTVRSLVSSIDANLPVSDVRSLEETVNRSVAPERFNTILLGVFSALALLLATSGIYGVLSYSMSRRTSEIGLRVALGAGRPAILRMAVVQGMRPVLAGLAIGAVGAAWLSRYFATLLFNVKPLDAATYAAVAAILIGAALAACYIPGRRASRIDSAIALRIE
jgi:putative ABC transport system permease protein